MGHFAELDIKEDRDSIANTCTFTLPIYAIGAKPGGKPEQRIRAALEGVDIKPGAKVEIYGWYYDNEVLEQKFDKLLLFSGYIRQVIGGFPSTIICEDGAFILRFGTIDKEWNARTKLKDMVEYLIPIANDAFEKFRKAQGLSGDFTKLSFDSTDSADIEFALKTFKLISPYEALSKLMKMFVLYSHVDDEGKIYFGIGVKDKFKETVKLSTDQNVIARDIVPTNGLFETYKVEVNGLMADGTRYTYVYGDDDGEPDRRFSPLNTKEGIQQVAKNVMARLKGNRNKGTITTVLYPAIKLFDIIDYTDTLFSELSSRYYVIGRNLRCGEDGFIQTSTVTDETFIL